MKKIFQITIALIIVSISSSCKKELNSKDETSSNVEIGQAKFVKNIAAPNGVLHFPNKESLRAFMEKIKKGADPEIGSLPTGFISLRDKVNKFKKTHPNYDKDITYDDNTFDEEQYIYDLDKYIVQDEEVEHILNEDLQIMIGDKFYEMTRLGVIEVDTPKLQEFVSLMQTNEQALTYDKLFTAFPNETLLTSDPKSETYQIQDGIVREKEKPIYLMQADDGFFDNGSGGGSGGGGGSSDPGFGGGYPEGNELLPAPEPMETYTTGTDFDYEVHKRVGNRRFKFQCYNHNYFFGAYKTIGIKGKLQRLREFWIFSWWGESFADEITVGIENMDLRTTSLYPAPQNFNTLARPNWDGISRYTLGNFDFDVINFKVNLSASFMGYTYNLTTQTINTFANGEFNKYVGGQFDNLFRNAVNDVASSFDPTFIQRYKDYAANVESLDWQNRLQFGVGYIRKHQGYSHINRWVFDWNVGGTVKLNLQTGSVISGSTQTYDYKMKHGSFFGKARLGNYWWKYRIVVSE